MSSDLIIFIGFLIINLAIGLFYSFCLFDYWANTCSENEVFLGKLSVAEAMGEIYGKHARIVTAIAAIGLSSGVIALQIKVLSGLLDQFFYKQFLWFGCKYYCYSNLFSFWRY